MPLYGTLVALRLAAMVSAPPERRGPGATREELLALVEPQLARWRQRGLDRAATHAVMRRANDTLDHVFIFEIEGRSVKVWDKHAPPPARIQPGDRAWRRTALPDRAFLYRILLEGALRRKPLDMRILLAIDTSDGEGADISTPLFGFQRLEHEQTLLLPDVDFFYWGWYANVRDVLSYEEKEVAACFVGASTGGGRFDEKAVLAGTVPRLRAASYFVDNPLVRFRIAQAVQCKDAATYQLVTRQRYFGESMPWKKQLKYRFLISMDGNGAACSRLVIALQSQSVVLKYESNSLLYYFPALQAGREYVAIKEDADVEPIVRQELAEPGRFKPIAEAGQRFVERYLNVQSVVDYTTLLVHEYARLWRT